MPHARFHPPFGAVVVAVAAFSVAVTGTQAATEITLGNTTVGVTPLYLGYNAGHYYDGSNTSAWAEYSGANAFRIFAPSSTYEPSDPPGLRSGDAITTLSQFDSRKADLRLNPEGTTYTDWASYNSKFANTVIPGRNNLKLDYVLGQMNAEKFSPILQIQRGGSTPMANWGDKWEQWHAYYVMAYHAAKDFGVTRYQMYNEPDLPTNAARDPQIGPADWLARMKLASDAIRSAIADVDVRYGKTLVPDLSGPTGIGGQSTYDNYGQPAIQTNRTDYAGRAVSYDILNTYDLHRYGTSPNAFINDINLVRTGMEADAPTHTALPVSYTEFNSNTSSGYAGSTDTADTPRMFTFVAADMLAAVSKDVKAMYAFKFNQTGYDPGTGVDEPQKTGMFYVNDTTSPYNTTGATLGGETIRLIARAFKGERPRLAQSFSAPLTNYDTGSSYDPVSKNHYFVGVNRTGAAAPLTFDLSSWGVAVGSVISVEEVSAHRHGEVTQLITVPANRKITINQPIDSVTMLTAPGGPAATARRLTPVADAQVRNDDSAAGGDNRTTNYGADGFARVGRANDNATGDYVSYLKFDLGQTSAATIDRAILQLTGQTLDGGEVSFHVYALTNDNWTSAGINWNNAPNLLGAADSALLGVGTTAFPVGTLTFDGSLDTTGLDLTDYLHTHPDQLLSLAVIREEQFAGDAEASYARLTTSESATPPTLTLFGGTSVPEPTVASLLCVAVGALRRRVVKKA